MPGSVRASGSEASDGPVAAGAASVEDAVVQSVLTALPEFDGFGDEAVAAPVRRARYRAGIFARVSRVAALERRAVRHRLALRRSPCRELAAARARGEILVRFARRHFRNAAVHAHLPLEPAPVEKQARARIASKLASLAAAV